MEQVEEPFRVGTRKSQLALVQTQTVIQRLKQLDPTLKFETLPMSTTGDKILDSALSKIGEKALFTKELENALLKGQVDFVVHSLKDLPTTLPENLVIGCVLKRDNPYDAVVMHPKHGRKTLKDLPPDSVIGTSSLRRSAQLQKAYPHFKFENIRGNLNTRFKKLAEQDIYDAIILAVAGLERLNWQSVMSQVAVMSKLHVCHHQPLQVLSPEECMYAVSQGAMAVECREGDEKTIRLLQQISDHETTISVIAERAFLRKLEGGCSVPVSGFTEISDRQMMVKGGVFSIDGQQAVKHTVMADLDNPLVPIPEDSSSFVGIHCYNRRTEYTSAWAAGEKLAEEMIEMGADVILAAAKATTKEEILAEHEKKKSLQALIAAAEQGEPSQMSSNIDDRMAVMHVETGNV